MPRIALINLCLGFTILVLAAAGGAFVSFDMTQAHLHDPALLDSWQLDLLKSAHGHTNLFGLLHIALGLTLPYSPWRQKWKVWQTLGLFLGAFAMGPLMMARAFGGPSDSFDLLGLTIGFCLSCALASLAAQAMALFQKILARQ